MKNPVLIIAAIVVIVAVGAGIFIATSKSSKTSTDNMSNMASSSSSTSSTQSTTATQTNKVSISNFAFSPSDITVKKGTEVTWTNNDSVAHTVTSDTSGGPNSGQLSPGKTYSFTFNTVGSFSYHCSIHTEMTGKVTVTE